MRWVAGEMPAKFELPSGPVPRRALSRASGGTLTGMRDKPAVQGWEG